MNRHLIFATCMFLLIAGCIQGPDRDIESRIFVSPNNLRLFVGDEETIVPSPTLESYSWASANSAIASVSSSGVIKGEAVGETVITVTSRDGTRNIPVVVTLPIADRTTGRPGVYRAAVELEILSDRIKSVKITRMDTQTAQTTPIDFQQGIFTAFFEGLSEGRYNFSVSFIDKHDLESEPVELSILVYGDQFKNEILASPPFTGSLIIEPDDNGEPKADEAAALVLNFTTMNEGASVVYTNIDGDRIVIPVTETPVRILDVDPQHSISYIASFLPDPNSVDDFEIEFDAFPKIRGGNPNIISMVNFDFGGLGIAYNSGRAATTAAQFAYRTNLGDTKAAAPIPIFEGSPNWNLGGIGANDWYNYTVYVEDAGNYRFNCEVAVNTTLNSENSISVNGTLVQAYTLRGTGSWTAYRWHWPQIPIAGGEPAPSQPEPVNAFVISLSAGWNTIRWTVGNPANCNLRRFSLTRID